MDDSKVEIKDDEYEIVAESEITIGSTPIDIKCDHVWGFVEIGNLGIYFYKCRKCGGQV